MAWPQANEFQEAVQNPGSAFSDPELQASEVGTTALGLPHAVSGQFGIVYEMKADDGRRWAVKCFTGPSSDRQRRYQAIGTRLKQVNLPFMVGIDYLERGIRIRGQWYPILKMDWVEGQTLNQFVGQRIDQPNLLDGLLEMWAKVAKRLRDTDMTHADLQHGNVMLIPGIMEGKVSLRLVDYDGMYLPTLAGLPSGEVGHRDFQHPKRLTTSYYGPEVDRFSHLVIYTALQAVREKGKSLWEKYPTADNLLFTQADFENPSDSKILHDLWANGSDDLRALTGRLVLATKKAIKDVPHLNDVLADGRALPLTGEQVRGVNRVLNGESSQQRAALPSRTAVDQPPSPSRNGLADLRRRWNELIPNKRTRLGVVLGSVGIVLLAIGIIVAGRNRGSKPDAKEQEKEIGSDNPQRVIRPSPDDKIREFAWWTGWNEQKDLLTWPKGLTPKQVDLVKNLKFGDTIPNAEAFRAAFAQEAYRAAYGDLIDNLGPITCRVPWTQMLQVVENFQRMPTSEEVWLAMENLWVQRELLACLQQVNADAGRFAVVAPADGVKEQLSRRSFRSRIWQIELAIVDQGNQRSLEAKVTNISSRLQILGSENVMKLQVWLSNQPDSAPFVFEVEAVAVEAGKTLAVKPLASHLLPAELRAMGIYRVEQVFDVRTAPVKRLEQLALAYKSDKDQRTPLRMATFSDLEAAKEPAAGVGPGPVGPGPVGTKTPNGLVRLRYLDVNDQVRRLPFGMSVVVEQEFMADVLEAMARTKLRCQITQSHWARFRDTIEKPVAPMPLPIGAPMGPGPGPVVPVMPAATGDSPIDNLVELSLYGVVSLDERFPADRSAPARPAEPEQIERASWLKLLQFINGCLPVPGPKGNLKGDLEKLWNTLDGGQRATEQYLERQRAGVDLRSANATNDLRQFLPSVDIEAIHCRHTANLEGFFKKAREYCENFVGEGDAVFDSMDAEERKPLLGPTPAYPTDAGWVFEIRGTTWYEPDAGKTRDFIRTTLLRNIQQRAKGNKPVAGIDGKISHVFLYTAWRDANPRPATFHFIHSSLIDNLVPVEIPMAVGPPGMGPGSGANAYQSVRIGQREGGGAKLTESKSKARYEFVIVFIWREPHPAERSAAAPPVTVAAPAPPFFDPIVADTRRVNPKVLGVSAIQADFLWARILAYDILPTEDGRATIGVLNHKPPQPKALDKESVTQFCKEIARRQALPRRPMPKGGPMGMPPMGLPPGPIGGPMDPGFEPGLAIPTSGRFGVEYVPLDPEKLDGKRLALTLNPQRMVVVQAAFPLKAQLEETARALRLNQLSDVHTAASAAPAFRGFIVERQRVDRNGKAGNWEPLDVNEQFAQTIHSRKLADLDEAPDLQSVMLPPEHELTMPLPRLFEDKYPDVRIPAIRDAIRTSMERNQPPVPFKAPANLQGRGNLFKPVKLNPVAVFGQPNAELFESLPPRMDAPIAADPKSIDEVPAAILVRFIDNSVEPGTGYRYRIKVRMQNPNWVGPREGGRVADPAAYERVARRRDADIEVIEGPFVEMNQIIVAPRESQSFAVDPPPADLKAETPPIRLRHGEGLIQIQRWLPYVNIKGFFEPVGNWIAPNVIAAPGRFLGGEQLILLPIWSSEANNYLQRAVASERFSKSTRYGVLTDPARPGPKLMVVAVDGGLVRGRFSGRTLEEETATEILLLNEDGSMRVLRSTVDNADATRLQREKAWRDWSDNAPTAIGSSPKKNDNPFAKKSE